jgi:2-iminobutanoate/2-iminopropanoate deaminase
MRTTVTRRITLATALAALGGLPALGACGALRPEPGTTPAHTPARQVIAPPGSPTIAPYSPAVRTGDLVFLSGQIGLRPGTRELVAGGITAETRQTLDNVRALLDAAGLATADVVKCTVFLADIAEFEAMNAVYGPFFGSAPPARTTVGVAGLPLGARVEIDCIANARR